MTLDLLVLGSGIAGLTCARQAAHGGASVAVLTKGSISASATSYAQGGVAAALEPTDSVDLHVADTVEAGAGLCDREAVELLARDGPARVRELAADGAHFDSATRPGSVDGWHLTREGGHSMPRVVHAGGDATGAEIERALVDASQRDDVEVREQTFVVDLMVEGGECRGVSALDPQDHLIEVRARDVVLATGGAGQCFEITTNPELSTGDGVAAALRAGVACADLEFVQFHPTALAVEESPRPLVSEALRGEGAILRDVDGHAFMADVHRLGDLAPRDIVARAAHTRMLEAGMAHVWLDATAIDDLDRRFPGIAGVCRRLGIDPAAEWLPVAPAAHYLCGGVVTDLDGATTLPGLWACGEVACSGVHGANRLASNSLLDGLVFGRRVVDAIAAGRRGATESGVMRGVRGATRVPGEKMGEKTDLDVGKLREEMEAVMARDCAVVRDAEGLDRAAATIAGLRRELGRPHERDDYEAANLLDVSAAILRAAQVRHESRGSHFRSDFSRSDREYAGRFVDTGVDELDFVEVAPSMETA